MMRVMMIFTVILFSWLLGCTKAFRGVFSPAFHGLRRLRLNSLVAKEQPTEQVTNLVLKVLQSEGMSAELKRKVVVLLIDSELSGMRQLHEMNEKLIRVQDEIIHASEKLIDGMDERIHASEKLIREKDERIYASEKLIQEKDEIIRDKERVNRFLEQDILRAKGLFTSRGVVEMLLSKAGRELCATRNGKTMTSTEVALELDDMVKNSKLDGMESHGEDAVLVQKEEL